MSAEELWNEQWGHHHEHGGINSPVTIVEGRGGPGCGPAPTINLEQYTDFVLRKFERQQEWASAAGTQNPGPNFSWGVTNGGGDSPLKAIGSVVKDAMYLLTAGLICKAADAGSGTLTLHVTYYDVLLGSTVVPVTLSMTATGQATTGPTPIFLLGGSAVTISVQNSGAYLTSLYDAFVGLSRVA